MKIFESGASEFVSNGSGVISDALSCVVTQTLNGMTELQMTYPVSGMRYAMMQLRNIIVAESDPVSGDQPFRIYRITKPLNGVITIYARHLAYDLQGIVCAPFSADTLGDTLTEIPLHASTPCPFTFDTDKTVNTAFTLPKPMSIWELFSGWQGSLLDVYGGEFEFDNYDVYLHSHRGQDRGVSIAYGKNLTSYSQDQNNAAVWTGIYPYWYNSETLVTLPEQIIPASGTYDFTRIYSLDLTSDFETEPSESDLRDRANAYIAANDIGVPKVSWTISFAQLEQSEEYKNSGILTRVLLGDTVHITFPLYNVTASARAVTTKWNAILHRYESVTLGSVKSSLAQTIAAQEKEIETKPSETHVTIIAEALAKGLLGANDGAIRLLDTNNDGSPDELYIADNPNPALAVNVWRWNYRGWAASTTGYDGVYTMGATLEDGLLADFVTAAHLVAGTIKSADGTTFVLDLDNGTLNMDVTSIKLNGEDMALIINGVAQDAADALGGVSDEVDSLKAHIEINPDGSVTFKGANGDPITLWIENSQLKIKDGENTVAYFGSGGAFTPNLTVEEGGSLTMGRFKWTPRSNGNLSLLYVGE